MAPMKPTHVCSTARTLADCWRRRTCRRDARRPRQRQTCEISDDSETNSVTALKHYQHYNTSIINLLLIGNTKTGQLALWIKGKVKSIMWWNDTPPTNGCSTGAYQWCSKCFWSSACDCFIAISAISGSRKTSHINCMVTATSSILMAILHVNLD